MAFDYKTLQEMAANEPRPANDYCPECGRPWIVTAPEGTRSSAAVPWRAAILVAVGLLLTLSFGLRERRVDGVATRDPLIMRGALACVTTPSEADGCRAGASVSTGMSQYSTPGGVLLHDLLVVASGAAFVLVGIGVVIRSRLPTRSYRPPAFVLACWVVGETLTLCLGVMILALYADLLIVRLSLGWPHTFWETLDPITDQVSSLFTLITRF